MSSRSVFVGNLPYDIREEMFMDIFRVAGPVVSARLVYDKDTGKPKGFGYVEFADAATALSAIRNLNGAEFNGRTLRVDVVEEPPEKDEMEEEEPPAKKRRLEEQQQPISFETMPLQELLKMAFTPAQEVAIRRLIADRPMPIPQPTFTEANRLQGEEIFPPGMK